jgi:GNAT superfamily N-acetyltransferase
MPLTLTLLTPDSADVEAVVALLGAQMREHALPDAPDRVRAGVLDAIDRPEVSRLLMARGDHAVIGVALMHLLPSIEWGGRSLWIEELYVAPAHRRTGVARALLAEALRIARQAGATGIDLETTPGHAAAEQLYAQAGFERRDRQRWALLLT